MSNLEPTGENKAQFEGVDYSKSEPPKTIYSEGMRAGRKETLNEVIGLIDVQKKELENPQISYASDIDITELPEGLIAEMTGVKKGWTSALDTLSEKIKSLIK